MSHVELALRGVEAFNRTFTEGTDEYFEFAHEEVEWIPITALLDGATYRGHDAVREWMDELRRDWEVFEVTWDEVRDLDDDRVLAIGNWHARGRRTGVELRLQQATWLVYFRDRKVIRLQAFNDRDRALKAVGLREEAAMRDEFGGGQRTGAPDSSATARMSR